MKLDGRKGWTKSLFGIYLPDAMAAEAERTLKSVPAEIRALSKTTIDNHEYEGFRRKASDNEMEFPEGERADISKVSLDVPDYERDVVTAKYPANRKGEGAEWRFWQEAGAPVLLGHSRGGMQLGRAQWMRAWSGTIKYKGRNIEANGIRAKTEYLDTPDAEALLNVINEGGMRGKSIGFIPTAIRELEEKDFEKRPEWKDGSWLISAYTGLEYSVVTVGANPYATVEAVSKVKAKGLYVPPDLLEAYGLSAEQVIKGAIGFKDYGMQPEGTAWDAGAQVRAADTDTLKKICTWFDSANADKKSAYKLPHHNAKSLKANWRGVAAAMGALLGARGGVAIPSGDRKGVYNHLSKHYKQFDKEPPEFKAFDDFTLKEIGLYFADVFDAPQIKVVKTTAQYKAEFTDKITKAVIGKVKDTTEDTINYMLGRP